MSCVWLAGVTAPCQGAGASNTFEEYVTTLCEEIALHRRVNEHPLQTVFFGGGTPSLIPPSQLHRILHALHDRFGIASDAEVSMEADPGTFDAARLREYLQLGLTRFSIGVQAFDQVGAPCLRTTRAYC